MKPDPHLKIAPSSQRTPSSFRDTSLNGLSLNQSQMNLIDEENEETESYRILESSQQNKLSKNKTN